MGPETKLIKMIKQLSKILVSLVKPTLVPKRFKNVVFLRKSLSSLKNSNLTILRIVDFALNDVNRNKYFELHADMSSNWTTILHISESKIRAIEFEK